jgi:GDPmannose 4,6-dehydratase
VKKKAIITGVSGQDGTYLSKLLLDKGYQVLGLTRSLLNIKNNFNNYLKIEGQIIYKECDLLNYNQVYNIISDFMPDEIYNLSAQSSVGNSFSYPQNTLSFNTISVLNLLESIRNTSSYIKFYQASSSEMFGNVKIDNLPIKESNIFHPVSPYGISKASAHWITVNYREAYNLFASCGILFNHESCLRSNDFVIKKIINSSIKIKMGLMDELVVGNLSVIRDWGYAPLYVEAMWKMLQLDKPSDFIICSGTFSSLQNILIKVFNKLELDIYKHLRLSPKLLRSLDLSIMYGDNSKAKNELNWEYNLDIDELLDILIEDENNWIKGDF